MKNFPQLTLILVLTTLMALTFCMPASAGLPPEQLILVPDLNNRRIMAFDPFDGDVYDLDFIPYHEFLHTPWAVAEGPIESILVSEGATNAVHRFSVLTGEYLGVFAPWSGVDTEILQSPVGMYKFKAPDTSNLLVVSGGSTGANADSIVEFDGGGTYIGTRVAPGAAGILPRHVVKRGEPFNDLLVTDQDTGVVHRFDLNGNPLTDFAVIPGDGRPQQIHVVPSTGDVLVMAYWGASQGVNRFTSDGTYVATLAPPGITYYQGVVSLGNGNLLVTSNQGIFEIDYDGNLIATKTDSGASYPELINLPISGEIFRDGFETGNLEKWTGRSP